MKVWLKHFLLRLLLLALAAVLLLYFLNHQKSNSDRQVSKQVGAIQNLDIQISANAGQLKAVDYAVAKPPTNSIHILSDMYQSSAKAVASGNITPPKPVQALPGDQKAHAYNQLIKEPGFAQSLNKVKSALAADKAYLTYQTAVWKALANLLDYPATQNLADPSTAVQNQNAAKDGIQSVITSLNQLPNYQDSTLTEVKGLAQQAYSSAAQDKTADFIAVVKRVQAQIIANRLAFTSKSGSAVLQQVNSAESGLHAYIRQLQNL